MRVTLASLLLCATCTPSSPGNSGTPPIDPSKADRFIAYQEKLVPLLRAWTKTSRESQAKGRGGEYGGQYAEKYHDLGEQNGLSEDDLLALNEIAAFVVTRDDAMKERFAARSAQLEKSIAALPADQRTAASRTLEGVRRIHDNLLDLSELRSKYGDPIVAAMQRREPDLERLHAELADIR